MNNSSIIETVLRAIVIFSVSHILDFADVVPNE